MSETARERFHRLQREAVGGEGIVMPAARPALAGRDFPAELREAARVRRADGAPLELRRTALVERMARLGVDVSVGEVPHDRAEVEDLERMCAESEAAGQSK